MYLSLQALNLQHAKVENVHDGETAHKYVGLNVEQSLRFNAPRLGAFLVVSSTS